MRRAWHQNFKRTSVAERTSTDGGVFDSKQEMKRWETLKLMLVAGQIQNLRRQVSFDLIIPTTGRAVLTPTGQVASYTADFVYTQIKYNQLEEIIEDSKGYMGPIETFRIAVFEALHNKKVFISGSGGKPKAKPKTRNYKASKVSDPWIKSIMGSV